MEPAMWVWVELGLCLIILWGHDHQLYIIRHPFETVKTTKDTNKDRDR